MSVHLKLLDHPTRDDLRVYLERLQKAGQPEVRLVVRGEVFAVFGCTQAPAGLTDTLPVVLTLRTFALKQTLPDVATAGNELAADSPRRERPESVAQLDVVVLGRALLDRIAHMGILGTELEVPEMTTTVAWAGILPPVGGWEPNGCINAGSLQQVAADGIARVAATLPTDPGEAVVRAARAAVWGLTIAPGVPAAAAFACEAMGFLREDDDVQVSRTLTWTRLRSSYGEVLVRNFAG